MEKDILYLASRMCSNNVAGYHISWAFVETEGTASRLRQAGSEQNGNCLLISISVLNFEALDLGAKSSPPWHHVIFNYENQKAFSSSLSIEHVQRAQFFLEIDTSMNF